MPLAPDEPFDDEALEAAKAALQHAKNYGSRRDVTIATARIGAIYLARDAAGYPRERS